MTKLEYRKCEKMMDKAIGLAKMQNLEFEEMDNFLKVGNEVDAA